MSSQFTPEQARAFLHTADTEPVTESLPTIRRRAARRRTAEKAAAVGVTAVVAAAVVVPLALVGGSSPSSQSVTTQVDPNNPVLDLIGLWRVRGTGEGPGTSIAFSGPPSAQGYPGGFTVFRSCGQLEGTWAADRIGQFVAGKIGSGDGHCMTNTDVIGRVPWLTATLRFRASGNDVALLGADGARVALLLREQALPGPVSHVYSLDGGKVPTVTPQTEQGLASPAPLPEGVTPANTSDLIGRWRGVGKTGTPLSFVSFGRDKSWSGSDGCNGYAGRFEVGPAGQLLATIDEANGDVGCDISPAPQWVTDGGSVGLVGKDLVFYDRTGKRLGAIEPDPKH